MEYYNEKESKLRLFKKHKKKINKFNDFKDPIKYKKFIIKQLKKCNFLPNDIVNIIISYIDNNFYAYSCLSNKTIVFSKYKNNLEMFPSIKNIGKINGIWYSNVSPKNDNSNKYVLYPFKTCLTCNYSIPCDAENDSNFGFKFPSKNKKFKNDKKFECVNCLKKRLNIN